MEARQLEVTHILSGNDHEILGGLKETRFRVDVVLHGVGL